LNGDFNFKETHYLFQDEKQNIITPILQQIQRSKKPFSIKVECLKNKNVPNNYKFVKIEKTKILNYCYIVNKLNATLGLKFEDEIELLEEDEKFQTFHSLYRIHLNRSNNLIKFGITENNLYKLVSSQCILNITIWDPRGLKFVREFIKAQVESPSYY